MPILKSRGYTAAAAEAKGILSAMINNAKAADRDLDAFETARAETVMAEVNDWKRKAAKAAEFNANVDAINSIQIVDEWQDAGMGTDTKADPGTQAKGRTFGTKAVAAMGPQGAKALFTGPVGTPAMIDTAVTLPQVPNTLLDLLQRVPLKGTDSYEYLRQTVRDNKAAAVKDLAQKPTSIYTFTEVQDKVHTYAHLSEELPVRYLGGNMLGAALSGEGDHADLARILDTEMRQGVVNAVEADVLNGDGVDKIKGLMQTTGVRQQAFATDAITTLRKSITTMLLAGVVPNAWVLNPQDIENLELARENGTTGGFLLDQADSLGRVTKVSVVPSVAVPAGQGILADWSTAKLVVREDVSSVVATQSGDMFERNACKVRTEGRFGAQFLQPSAFLVADLTA